jgi:predicted nucleic acid-binding protein
MHVFIDTNILLTFFHFSKDDLDALNNVFASHKHGSATVYLTEQVRDEFRRNREAKIKDALKRFTSMTFAPQLPSFMRAYEEFELIGKLANELQEKAKAIAAKADKDITKQALLADQLIKEIFGKSEIIEVTDAVFMHAVRRNRLGNPPGKVNSIGDAINWILLMSKVPNTEDIHIISEDGDFYSQLDESRAHPFLEQEWEEAKKSRMHVYRTLSDFLKKNFDGVAFSFDKNKDALIDKLSDSGSFAMTHGLIENLESHGYFSLREVERVLEAAVSNDQVGLIVTDKDVSDFLNRTAVPRRREITRADYLAVLDRVVAEQTERDSSQNR